MTFPKSAKQIYNHAATHKLYNFELASARGKVLIITPNGIKQVIGHYYTHNYSFWINAIREALSNNQTTPNIT